MNEELKNQGEPHIYQLTIKETQIDSFGHVNNATYLSLFEEARWDLISQNNYGLKEIQKYQKGPVVLEAQIKYVKELKAQDKIIIKTWPENSGRKIARIYQEMESEVGVLHAKFQIVYGLMDLVTRKLISPTPEWIQAFSNKKY